MQQLLLWLAAGFAVTVHLLSARWHILFGAMNADEGFYAIASRSVAQGETPYLNFGFPQPPLILYANNIFLRFLGFGLFQQRAVNGCWAAIALLLAAVWLGRRTRPAWGMVLAISFSLLSPWMYFNHLGKTYGLSTLIVMLGGWAFLAMSFGPRRNFTLGALGALGVCTRLPLAPFFGVLLLLASVHGRRTRFSELAAAFGGVSITGILLPFWLAAPVSFKFWLFDLHRLSLPYRDWHLDWADVASLAPTTWLLTGFALIIVAWRRRWFTRESGLIVASVAGLATNLLPGGVYEEYGVPFLLPLAVAAAALLHDELKTRTPAIATAAVASLVVVQFCAAPLLNLKIPQHRVIPSCWLSTNAPPYNRSLPQQLAGARRVVEKLLPVNAPFIGSNIILAAETGRPVPTDLRMGPFSFTVEIPPDQAARLHLATHEEIDAWFANPDVTLIAFFQRHELNYGWSMPTFGQLRPEFHEQWFAPMRRNFQTAYETENDFLILARKSSRNLP